MNRTRWGDRNSNDDGPLRAVDTPTKVAGTDFLHDDQGAGQGQFNPSYNDYRHTASHVNPSYDDSVSIGMSRDDSVSLCLSRDEAVSVLTADFSSGITYYTYSNDDDGDTMATDDTTDTERIHGLEDEVEALKRKVKELRKAKLVEKASRNNGSDFRDNQEEKDSKSESVVPQEEKVSTTRSSEDKGFYKPGLLLLAGGKSLLAGGALTRGALIGALAAGTGWMYSNNETGAKSSSDENSASNTRETPSSRDSEVMESDSKQSTTRKYTSKQSMTTSQTGSKEGTKKVSDDSSNSKHSDTSLSSQQRDPPDDDFGGCATPFILGGLWLCDPETARSKPTEKKVDTPIARQRFDPDLKGTKGEIKATETQSLEKKVSRDISTITKDKEPKSVSSEDIRRIKKSHGLREGKKFKKINAKEKKTKNEAWRKAVPRRQSKDKVKVKPLPVKPLLVKPLPVVRDSNLKPIRTRNCVPKLEKEKAKVTTKDSRKSKKKKKGKGLTTIDEDSECSTVVYENEMGQEFESKTAALLDRL
jgi:hypothetical protein